MGSFRAGNTHSLWHFIVLLVAVGAEYDGACDDAVWRADELAGLTLNTGAVYSAVYDDGGCTDVYSSGTSMNYESLNCGGSPDGGNICLRCIEGELNVAHFASGVDPFAAVTDDASFLSASTASATSDCNDGCGQSCIALGAVSARVAWHSQQTVCSAAPECPAIVDAASARAPPHLLAAALLCRAIR